MLLEISALMAIAGPTPEWGVTAVPDVALAASSGGTRVAVLGRLGSDQMAVAMQATAQDLRTGFDNWFADRNDLAITNAATFGAR